MSNAENAVNYWKFQKGLLEKIADPNTTVDIVGAKVALVDQYRFFEFLDTNSVLDNGLKAEKEGYDAIAIGNILDPGLYELRQMLDIPVLGLCETSLLMAHMIGQRFSLIAVNEYFIPRIEENIMRYGLEKRLVSIDTMRSSPPMLDKAFTDPDMGNTALNEFYEGARKTIKKGAEVIIPAGGRLMAFLAAQEAYEIDGIVILNGITTLLMLTETAVKLKSIMRTFTSRKRLYVKPSTELLGKRSIEEIFRLYGQAYGLNNLIPKEE
jgi:Asp/Glu/hydantoin racemase